MRPRLRACSPQFRIQITTPSIEYKTKNILGGTKAARYTTIAEGGPSAFRKKKVRTSRPSVSDGVKQTKTIPTDVLRKAWCETYFVLRTKNEDWPKTK